MLRPLRTPKAALRLLVAASIVLMVVGTAHARGVSPYLPLHESPEIERMIERVLILGDQPVLKRPIAAGTVVDALPLACKKDVVLCQRVRHYLDGLKKNYGLSRLSVSVSATQADGPLLVPNRHGMPVDGGFDFSGQIYWQPGSHFLLSAGLIAHEGELAPTGTMLSFGVASAQVDIGYRDHWLSPMTDSAMLLSTEAETMPSITISNYKPLSVLGIRYEFFLAQMSESDRIVYHDRRTSGHPRLAGMHLSIEPVSGWSLGVSRVLQFGGGPRPDSFGDLLHGFFDPSGYDNASAGLSEFGNQAAAVTSSFIMPTPIPFAVYVEYAGEDTSTNSNFRLGNSALSVGIHFPNIAHRFDVTVETSEWQNAWYVHHLYLDGLTNEGAVIGHWGAGTGWRVAGDGVGARSLMARVGWQLDGGAFLEATYRTLENEGYTAPQYDRAQELNLRYSRRWADEFYVGAKLNIGHDSFGQDYSRLSVFLRF